MTQSKVDCTADRCTQYAFIGDVGARQVGGQLRSNCTAPSREPRQLRERMNESARLSRFATCDCATQAPYLFWLARFHDKVPAHGDQCKGTSWSMDDDRPSFH